MNIRLVQNGVSLKYEFIYRKRTIFLSLTSDAFRHVSTKRPELLRADGTFGREGVMETDYAPTPCLSTYSDQFLTWSFPVRNDRHDGRLRHFLRTVNEVTSVLNGFVSSPNDFGTMQLMTIDGISGQEPYSFNASLSSDVMRFWKSESAIGPNARRIGGLIREVGMLVSNGTTDFNDEPCLSHATDGYLYLVSCPGSLAAMKRCEQLFYGEGAVFRQHRITTDRQQFILLCAMAVIADCSRGPLFD